MLVDLVSFCPKRTFTNKILHSKSRFNKKLTLICTEAPRKFLKLKNISQNFLNAKKSIPLKNRIENHIFPRQIYATDDATIPFKFTHCLGFRRDSINQ